MSVECKKCGTKCSYRESKTIVEESGCYRCRNPEDAKLPESIVSSLIDIEAKERNVRECVEAAVSCDVLVSKVGEQGISAHVSSVGDGINQVPGVGVHINGVESMDIVKAVLVVARDAGLKRTKSAKPSTYPELGRLTYYYENATIMFFFPSPGAGPGGEQCRFVECGEKVVKEYKLVCSDSVQDELPEAGEQKAPDVETVKDVP